MTDGLSALASYLKGIESTMKTRAEEIRGNPQIQNESFFESQIIHSLTKTNLDSSVSAIDSGFVSHSLHGADAVAIKCVSVNFIYKNSKLLSHTHFPSPFPQMEIEFKTALDDHESNLFRNLIRLKREISIAIDSINKFSPSCVLLDGSLLPLAGDRPSKESQIFSLYEEIILLYKNLYSLCETRKIKLFGVIKDSRAKRFVDLFDIKNACDSFFLNYLLKKGERTFVMRYGSSNTHATPVLKDLEPFSNKICVFYMKTNENDFPLRIEFLNPEAGSDFNSAADFIYSLCCINEAYAYPAPLIEADICAAIRQDEAENIFDFNFSAGVIKPLRRNSRPFR